VAAPQWRTLPARALDSASRFGEQSCSCFNTPCRPIQTVYTTLEARQRLSYYIRRA
jgi:hypothetical protein